MCDLALAPLDRLGEEMNWKWGIDVLPDGGTTVVEHNVTLTTLVVQTQSGTTAPASVQYTDTARTIYCNITNTVDATTAGSFTFIIEYVQIA